MSSPKTTRRLIAEYLRAMGPGDILLTRDLASDAGVSYSTMLRYLRELNDEETEIGALAAEEGVYFVNGSGPTPSHIRKRAEAVATGFTMPGPVRCHRLRR